MIHIVYDTIYAFIQLYAWGTIIVLKAELEGALKPKSEMDERAISRDGVEKLPLSVNFLEDVIREVHIYTSFILYHVYSANYMATMTMMGAWLTDIIEHRAK